MDPQEPPHLLYPQTYACQPGCVICQWHVTALELLPPAVGALNLSGKYPPTSRIEATLGERKRRRQEEGTSHPSDLAVRRVEQVGLKGISRCGPSCNQFPGSTQSQAEPQAGSVRRPLTREPRLY